MKTEIMEKRRQENLIMIRETFETILREANKRPGIYSPQWSQLFLEALETQLDLGDNGII